MRVPDAETSYVQYKLARSGAQYDNDTWSDPEEIEPTLTNMIFGLLVRPVGSPRIVWKKAGSVVSNTGEIDSHGESEPRIAVDPYDGEYEGPDYWNSWIMARNVFVCFSATAGNPGPLWDMKDEDECVWVKYYDYTECTNQNDPDGIRDPDDLDLVQTIIFKQVDP